MKHCTVVFATPGYQRMWRVALPDAGTVADALDLARRAAEQSASAADVSWLADVGIFGEICDRGAVPRDGDRIEIYRPLRSDPKESRRERARARKVAPDRASSRVK